MRRLFSCLLPGLLLLTLGCGGDDGGSPSAPRDGAVADAALDDAASAQDAASNDASVPTEGDGAVAAPYTASAELTALLTRVQTLKQGKPADLDNDGTAEAELVKNADGSSAYTAYDMQGSPLFVRTYDGKGRLEDLIDRTGDGTADEAITVVVTADSHTRTRLVDENGNTKPDHRYRWTTARATPAVQTYTRSEDLSESGTFTDKETLTLTTTKHQDGAKCEGSDGFPSGGTDVAPFPGSPNIKSGTSAGACNASDTRSISRALDCALTKGALCLANTNTQQYNALMSAAFGEGTMPLDIGCGNGCAGTLASTRSWSAPWFSNSTLNINPSEWNKLDDDGKCNIMLHELLHWAGDNGSADHNESSGKGDDQVYSCGRYCGRCSDAGHGSPKNSAIDCAKCADTAARKSQCGAKSELKTGSCDGELTGLCHKGLACISANCETCGRIERKTCDDKPLGVEIACCATCPSNCNASNDLPCDGMTMSEDTCTKDTPPFCPN